MAAGPGQPVGDERVEVIDDFPMLITNPNPEAGGPLTTDVVRNMVTLDRSRGRTRGGLELFNDTDWSATDTTTAAVRIEAPPPSSADAIVAVVNGADVTDHGDELIGLWPFTTRSRVAFTDSSGSGS